jgi:hypothetical protein
MSPLWRRGIIKKYMQIVSDSGIYPLKMVDLSIVMNGNGILVGGLEP